MFEKFKKNLQDKIEKNAVKSNLRWVDGSGVTHTEEVLLKRSRLPFVGDWGRIYPPVNEDGTLNWINFIFGGKANMIRLIFILGVVALVLLQFYEIFSYIDVLKSEPCYQVCNNISVIAKSPLILP